MPRNEFLKDERTAYRLGDAFYHEWPVVVNSTKTFHSGTIADEYLKNRTKKQDFQALQNAVQKKCVSSENQDVDLAVHVRLGDATCHTYQQATTRAPVKASELAENIATSFQNRRVTLFHGTHTPACQNETEQYVEELSKQMEVRGVPFDVARDAHADNHLCQMVNSRTFVQGKGGYSALVGRLRDATNRDTVRDPKLFSYKSLTNGGGTI
tara:strand:+ start:356 stop:988 length:633 start_codon:yes stop_codon:yes gene_type:complete